MKLRIVGTAKQWTGTDSPEMATVAQRTVRQGRCVPLICADPLLTQQYLMQLREGCEPQHVPLIKSAGEARQYFVNPDPPVILLDESALGTLGSDSIEPIVAMLTEVAPIVVVAAPERQEDLAFLITSGAVDFVARKASFIQVAVGLIDRRIQLADCAAGLYSYSDQGTSEDFGEILRHEVNNPLTGILGNAELLLARRDRLPPDAASRVEIITELAVRLRETVRRLSDAWMIHHNHIGSR